MNNQQAQPNTPPSTPARTDGFESILGPLPSQPINSASVSFADKIAAMGQSQTSDSATPPAQKSGLDYMKEDVTAGRQSIDQTNNDYATGKIGAPEAFLQHIGTVVGTAFSLPLDVVKSALNDPNFGSIKWSPDSPAGKATDALSTALANPEIATQQNGDKLMQKAGDLYHQASQETDPAKQQALRTMANQISNTAKIIYGKADDIVSNETNAGKDVQAVANIGGAVLGATGSADELASKAAGTAKGAVEEGANAVKPVIDKVGDVTSGVVQKVFDAASSIKKFIKPSLTPEEQVGQIIQGKISDIPAAQRTFEALPSDTTPVSKMSPDKLSSTIDSKIIKPNLDSVDAQFAKDTSGGKSIKSFEQTVGTGKSAVKVNYVQNAIDELKTYYTKTGDAEGLSNMKALENKAKINGLTSQDINNLARLHGNEINAFNANGEAASGLSKQAAENTRSGLKTTARNSLAETNPEAAAEATRLDRETSDAIKTKKLLDAQTEKLNKRVQAKGKESGLSKAYNSKTGKIVRTVAKVGVGAELLKKGLGL